MDTKVGMRLPLGLALLTVTLTELVGPGVAEAAMADCMSPDGSCEVNNDAGDFVSCACADGSGVAGGGTNDWAGLSELELQPICEEQLAMFCGPVPPPAGVQCMSPVGTCTIDNIPEDSLSCECVDGSGGGFAGGNMWAGLSEMELLDQCNMELASLCGGAPPPPPPSLECSSPLGECTIANQPADFLECTCADGMGFSGGGGNDWAELSEEELLMLCEEALAGGCAVGSETGGETGAETGEPGDTGETGAEGSTGGAGSTGGPGQDTGLDDSGGLSESSSSGTPDPTTGDDATGGATEGNDSGAEGDGGGGTSGCSVAPRSTAPAGWALVLLGLVGVRWRRRRAA